MLHEREYTLADFVCIVPEQDLRQNLHFLLKQGRVVEHVSCMTHLQKILWQIVKS